MLIVFAYMISVLIPLIIGAFGYRRLKIDMKILLALISLTFFVEIFVFYLSHEKANSIWVHNIYLPLEYILIALIFSKWHQKVIFGNIIMFSIPVFLIIHIVSLIKIGDINQINSFSISLSCTFYVCISTYALINLLKDDFGSIYQDYRFWVCSALLLYSAGSIAFWAFSRIIVSFLLYYIHLGVNIIAYSLFAGAFWKHIQREQSSVSSEDPRVR